MIESQEAHRFLAFVFSIVGRHNEGMHAEDIRALLKKITFAPSCVDMGWDWEVEWVEGSSVSAPHMGFLIRTTFRRPDRDSGVIATGYGRWWHVPPDVTPSGVVKTAFAAAKMILEHELMESFRFEGERLFDPHHTIDDLYAATAHARWKRVVA